MKPPESLRQEGVVLVLNRRFGESIRIGETTVTVVRIDGGKVRIGIQAPPQVSISRAELCHEPADSAAATGPPRAMNR